MKSFKFPLIVAAVAVLLFTALALLLINADDAENQSTQQDDNFSAPVLDSIVYVPIAQDTVASDMILPQAKPPVLNIGGKKNADVYLQSLDIQVEVNGNIASTRYTMVFKNKTNRILEGELSFPLPDERTVTYYALDINARMRDAVPVEKARATQVFEEIQRREVDPGLLERIEGNNFRTRIYPIPANGVRTISIGYEEELTLERGLLYYRLPMAYPDPIEKFALKATVLKSTQKPLVPKSDKEISFGLEGKNYVASLVRKNHKPAGAFVFALPSSADTQQVIMQAAKGAQYSFAIPIKTLPGPLAEKHYTSSRASSLYSTSVSPFMKKPEDGSYYFLASVTPQMSMRKKRWSDELSIIWDVSLSASQRNLQSEMEVLDIIFSEKKNANIHLYFLNNKLKKAGEYKVENGNWNELKNILKTAIYDGGTDFSQINLDNIAGKEILFFSDGISTLSNADFLANRPVHCIVSSPRADYSAMKLIAGKARGKFINLNALSFDGLKDVLLNETMYFLGTEHESVVREVYPSIAMPVQSNFSVAGISDTNKTELTLLFGFGNNVEKRIKVKLDSENFRDSTNLAAKSVHKIWAQKKIAELELDYESNRAELTELGKLFGIVTRNSSLIVLEFASDYARYGIRPPSTDLKLQAEYESRSNRRGSGRWTGTAVLNKLNEGAVTTAERLKVWWNTGFSRGEARGETGAGTQPRLSEKPRKLQGSGGRPRGSGGDMPSAQAEIFSQPAAAVELVRKDKDYLNKLTGNVSDDYQIYLKLRTDYANSPAFYFDMANRFYELGDKERALRILTSIAELELENASHYRLLAYKFKEYGEFALQKFVCQKVIQWRPKEPQSYRDYALALADNGEEQAALDSLYSIIKKPIDRRNYGIIEVIVTEINRLISKNAKLNTSKIDKRLIINMPVDIRIVINWNIDNTDIDLHVKGPSTSDRRENHNNVSGYGPEQFMIKSALTGKYKVYANYNSARVFASKDPVTVMAEIYTKYAGEAEQRRIVSLQLSKEKVEIAEFEL